MSRQRLPIIAKVECRSESRGEERPVAVWLGGERCPVVDIVERAFHGGAEAGSPVMIVFTVIVDDGSELELTREGPEGDWRVTRLM